MFTMFHIIYTSPELKYKIYKNVSLATLAQSPGVKKQLQNKF